MAHVWPDRTEVCPELINACLRDADEEQARHYQALYKKKFPTSADVYSCDTILDLAAGGKVSKTLRKRIAKKREGDSK